LEAELDLRSFGDRGLHIKGRTHEKPQAVVKAEGGFESGFRERPPETRESGESVKSPVKGLA